MELENTSPPPTPYHHMTEVLRYSSFYPISALLLKKKKITAHTKRQKTQFEEREQASKPDPDMARILELWDQEPNTALINMLRALVDKVDNTHKLMGNVRRKMEILRENQNEMLEVKTL